MRSRLPLTIAWCVTIISQGCAVDDRSFYIRQNQVPNGTCQVDTSAGEFRGSGLLDISGRLGYKMFPLVQNQLVASAMIDKTQPERNNLHMRRFDVAISTQELPVPFPGELTSFSVPQSGMVPVGAQAAFTGVKVVKDQFVQLISMPAGLRPYIYVEVTAVADRSGEEMSSASFVYPIELCNGCLVDFRASCPTVEDASIRKNPCGLPQDDPVTCCTDAVTKQLRCYSGAKTP